MPSMNSIKFEGLPAEIDDRRQLENKRTGEDRCDACKNFQERRLGFDRRCFLYTAYVPERRSGQERRKKMEAS